MRHYTFCDKLFDQLNTALNALASDHPAARPNPADTAPEQPLTKSEQRQSAGFMRVNHTGEVCAQALYQGQMVVARNPNTRQMLAKAAAEETDHLAWTRERLQALNSRTSYLNPFWYTHSFAIGMIAGLAGDRWSLGFVEETERQVGAHLQNHLEKMSRNDQKSRAVIAQMQIDEAHHGQSAVDAGAQTLPRPIKTMMRWQAKVMTTLTYWI